MLLAEDGVVVDLVDGKASIVGSVPIGNVYVDGLNVGDVGEESLQARRILGDEGFVALTVVIELSTRTIVRDRCTCRPAASPTTRPRSTGRCAWSRRTSSARCRTTRSTRTGCRRSSAGPIGKWVSDTYRRRPMIIPTVLEV